MQAPLPSLSSLEKSPPSQSFRALKIALLGYRSHPHVGGQGIYLKYLSRALHKLGHQVDVLSGPPYPDLDEGIRLIKIPSLDLYSHFPHHIRALRVQHLKSWSDFFEWLSMATGGFPEPYTFARRAAQYLTRNQHYDIIHDNQTLGFGMLDIQRKWPLVTTIHHPITRDLQMALENENRTGHRMLLKRWYSFLKMQKRVAHKLHHIVTVSHASKQDIAHAFGCPLDAITVIANGVDPQIFHPCTDIPRKPFRLLTTTSSDQSLKGFSSLLRALKLLVNDNKSIHLRVIGQLKPNGSNEQLMDSLNLRPNISFRSNLTDRQLVREYAKAQVVVCPSLYEGFGLPAIEAMSCGTPLVSSNGGALAEVVGKGGLLYPAGDDQQLASAVLRVLNDEQLRAKVAALGQERVKKHYSWETVAKQMSRYYYNVIESHTMSPHR